jgi:uncharacterized protein YgiB involved in biofilm formation
MARQRFLPKRMPISPRKSSRQVTLVLLGAATLVACSQDDRVLRRDVYASKENCVADWGDEVKCESSPATSQGGFHGFYWYGPAYRSGQFGSSRTDAPAGTVDGARPGSHAVFTSHVSRGGFGATGAAHGFGGGS